MHGDRTGSEAREKSVRLPPRTPSNARVDGKGARWQDGRLAPLALLLCWVVGTGCHTTKEAEEGILASVMLHGNTPGQISQVTRAVFQAHDYRVAEAGLTKLTFEKRGSGMNNFAYGSWMPDDPVWVRVRAFIEPAGEMTYRLYCRAWVVTDKGGPTEEEIKIRHAHHRPYDALLNEVADRLVVKPAGPP
jgi:hypothetical protein